MRIPQKKPSELKKIRSSAQKARSRLGVLKKTIQGGLTTSTIGSEEEEQTKEQMSKQEQRLFDRLPQRNKKRYRKRTEAQRVQLKEEQAAYAQKAGATAAAGGNSAANAAGHTASAAGAGTGRGAAAFVTNGAGSAPAGAVKGAAVKGATAAAGAASAGVATAAVKARRCAEKFRASLESSLGEKQKLVERMQRQAQEQLAAGRGGNGAQKALSYTAGVALAFAAQAVTFVTATIHALLTLLLTLLPFLLLVAVLAAVIFAAFCSERPARSRIVDIAEQELSVSEANIGGEKYKEWYGIDGNWCAMFVSWCANECGYLTDGVMPKTASVAVMATWYQERGLYQSKESGYQPMVGDIILFRNGMSHVGIVIDYDPSSKKVTTIEGNSGRSERTPYHAGSRVTKNTYSISYAGISGYGTPQYPADVIEIPEPYGTQYTYMGWQMITSPSSKQYKLREAAGMHFDADGFARIGERYVIACTSTFGGIGDYIDWELENGTVIRSVIGDIKSQNDPGCNRWGHNNGACVVEFVVDQRSWYGTGRHPTQFHPQWRARVAAASYVGSYW